MKFFLLSLFLLTSLSSSCLKQPNDLQEMAQLDSEQILIVYLSRTKNTKAVAEMIQEEVGGELVELELVSPYPENYRAIVAQVAQENESGFLPLKTKITNLNQYEVVFLGFPT